MFKLLLRTIQKNLSQISFLLLSLFLAFISGNMFGILSKIINPFLFLLITLFFLELLNFVNFSKKVKNNYFSNKKIIVFFNTAKRGFLIGIFVEAFKVGS